MNKIAIAQEFVKAVNPVLKSQVIDAAAFSEFVTTKQPDKEANGETNCLKSISNFKISERNCSNSEVMVSNKLHTNHVTFQRTYKVVYLGYAVLDRRYTLPMLPWVIAEIKRYGSQNAEDILLEVAESCVRAVNSETNKLVFEHKLQTISKFARTAQDPTCFTYMTREVVNGPCAYHVFQAVDESTVLELFTALREMTKEMVQLQSVLSPLTKCGNGIATDNVMTNGQNYEVMYLGRIKVSSKRAPPTFIDDAVEKFRIFEIEKVRGQQNSVSFRRRHGSGASVSSLPYSLDLIEQVKENELSAQQQCTTPVNKESISFTRSSAENVNFDTLDVSSRVIHKSCSDPFSITALSPFTKSDSFITGISPSISTSSFNESLETNGCQSKESLIPPSSLISHTQSLDTNSCADIVQDLHDIHSNTIHRDRAFSSSGDTSYPSKQFSLPVYRQRIGSGGSADMRRPRAFTSPAPSTCQQKNRTMLFLIGNAEICLIGMDKKQVLLNKTFNDIAHCSQGIKHLDHFGFICRETALAGADFYAGYIFRCQTEKVVDELMQSIQLAFRKAHQDYQHTPQPKSPNVPRVAICEFCPMQWFHRLCSDIEGLPPEEAHCIVLLKLHTLPETDRHEIMAKCEDADVNCLQERNEVLMMFLREFCEQKQSKHSHLNSGSCTKNDLLFVKEKTGSSKLETFREKAKKSLSSSFETILKLKHREDGRDRSLTSISDLTLRPLKDEELLDIPTHREGSYDGPEHGKSSSPLRERPRSSTFSTTLEARKANKKKKASQQKTGSPQSKSPIMNIFIKLGNQNQTPCSSEEENESPSKKGSWRQAIFHRVQTPVQTPKDVTNASGMKNNGSNISSDEFMKIPVKKTREQLRALWKKAILEQILLIRMEKENKKLQVSQDAVSHKRMKLDYEDITPCLKDSVLMWEELLNSKDRSCTRISREKLQELVKTGVPRNRRGEIWQFLAEQHNLRTSSAHLNFDEFDMPYDELLRQLTSHQHAILIDLGRTFPNHPFYAQPLGPGQLSLFNLLKAYSLLDSEVGYCQGLSFVSGILLLHMPEEQAFQMMKHILFHLGFRRQYKPDMVALQIQMYQLSRLMHDNYSEVYYHLEKYDIAPTLYAAPWFLTLFASQFPLGFVSRLFDLIFLNGIETIFKMALVLIGNQRDLILQCHGFEAIMDFLKNALPAMNAIEMQRAFNQVFTLDISKQLHAYEVEYHVLKEEMMYSPSRSDTELVQKLESANRNLKVQNMELMEQLQVTYSTVHNLEASEASYKSTIQRLEARVRGLEDEKEALLHSMMMLKKRLLKLEVACLAKDTEGSGDHHHPPSFEVVYALAGSEKQEEQQLKELIREFCKERESNETSRKGSIAEEAGDHDWIVINEEGEPNPANTSGNGDVHVRSVIVESSSSDIIRKSIVARNCDIPIVIEEVGQCSPPEQHNADSDLLHNV